MSGGEGLGEGSLLSMGAKHEGQHLPPLLSDEERRQKIAVERKFVAQVSLGSSAAMTMTSSAHAVEPPVLPVDKEYENVEVEKPKMVTMHNHPQPAGFNVYNTPRLRDMQHTTTFDKTE